MEMPTARREVETFPYHLGWLEGDGICAAGRYLSRTEWELLARLSRTAPADREVRFFLRLAANCEPLALDPSIDGELTAGDALTAAFSLGLPSGSTIYVPVPDAADGTRPGPAAFTRLAAIGRCLRGTGYHLGVIGTGWTCGPVMQQRLAASAWVGEIASSAPGASPWHRTLCAAWLDMRQRFGASAIAGPSAEDAVIRDIATARFDAFILRPRAATPAPPSPPAPADPTLVAGGAAYPMSPSLPLGPGSTDRLAVLAIQRRLNALGFGPLLADGDFGPGTQHAVQRFQRSSLGPDGTGHLAGGHVDARTWRALFAFDATRDFGLVPEPDPEPEPAPDPPGFLSRRWL